MTRDEEATKMETISYDEMLKMGTTRSDGYANDGED